MKRMGLGLEGFGMLGVLIALSVFLVGFLAALEGSENFHRMINHGRKKINSSQLSESIRSVFENKIVCNCIMSTQGAPLQFDSASNPAVDLNHVKVWTPGCFTERMTLAEINKEVPTDPRLTVSALKIQQLVQVRAGLFSGVVYVETSQTNSSLSPPPIVGRNFFTQYFGTQNQGGSTEEITSCAEFEERRETDVRLARFGTNRVQVVTNENTNLITLKMSDGSYRTIDLFMSFNPTISLTTNDGSFGVPVPQTTYFIYAVTDPTPGAKTKWTLIASANPPLDPSGPDGPNGAANQPFHYLGGVYFNAASEIEDFQQITKNRFQYVNRVPAFGNPGPGPFGSLTVPETLFAVPRGIKTAHVDAFVQRDTTMIGMGAPTTLELKFYQSAGNIFDLYSLATSTPEEKAEVNGASILLNQDREYIIESNGPMTETRLFVKGWDDPWLK